MHPTAVLLLAALLRMCAGQQELVVKLEQDVTLPCLSPGWESISVLKWSRPDLNTDGYVYFYRNRRSYENYQHPAFSGRVKLKEADMKGGDASLVLRNVTFNDTGMYECHISSRSLKRSKRDQSEFSHFISLSVAASDEARLPMQEADVEADGGAGSSADVLLVAGGAAGGVAAGSAIGGLLAFWICSRRRKPAGSTEYQSVV